MSLAQGLDAALAPGEVIVEGEGAKVRVGVRDVDRLGVELDHLRVEAPPRGRLRQRAQALSESCRELGERLRPVEVDEGLGGAVLRSRAEDRRGKGYFEVTLDPAGATLQRFRPLPEGGREPETFTLTREQLGRVVEDLKGR